MKAQRMALMISAATVMVFSFQNCGQQGSVAVEGGVTADKATSDTMVVNPDGANNDDGNTNSGAHVSSRDEDANCKDKEHSHGDGQSKEAEDSKSVGSCEHIKIADLMLKIKSIHTQSGASEDAIALEEDDAVISMNKLHVTIRANKDISKLKSVFLVLKDEGNKVLDFENLAHDMKTPSGQTAGIKVQLDSEISLRAGEIYSLQLSIDPAKQIISNPVKCLFKPVIKSARIVVALVDTLAM